MSVTLLYGAWPDITAAHNGSLWGGAVAVASAINVTRWSLVRVGTPCLVLQAGGLGLDWAIRKGLGRTAPPPTPTASRQQ